MKETFFPMTDAYRKHFYPKGYFAAFVSPGLGVVVIICGLVLALIGVLPALAAYDIILDYLKGETDLGTLIFMVLVFLVFFGGGAFIVWLGIKKMRMKEDDYIENCAKASGYTESMVREIGAQVVELETLRLEMAGDGVSGKGFLTRDFIMSANALNPCGIKIEDITKAYFTMLPHPTIRHLDCLWLMIYSNHSTCLPLEVSKKENGDRLVAMLLERNPAIQTFSGKILSGKEHDAMLKEIRNAG